MKPTDKQKQFVWEQCGWEYKVEKSHIWWKWDKPNEPVIIRDIPPPIDLSNLLKYADPILDKMGEHYMILQKKWDDYSVRQAVLAFVDIAKFQKDFEGEGDTYEDAVFEAIYKALGGKE